MNDALLKIYDEELYSRCKHFGEISLKYRWKFLGLLPEVNRRKLYKKKGFESIFHFAAKLAGVSEKQARRVLNLEKSFEDKPALKTLLVDGRVSANKLARVASVATAETATFWARQVKILPKNALETLVRDEKLATQTNRQAAVEDEKSVPGHTRLSENLSFSHMSTITATDLGLSTKTAKKLLELKHRGINIDDLFSTFLEKRELEIAREKEALSASSETTNSRYIPSKTRKLLKKEYGEKCSIKTCAKPAEQIHHMQRFSLAKIHDPKFLAPLCREHHVIAHAVDLQFHEFRARASP